jgi:hypothetical protein
MHFDPCDYDSCDDARHGNTPNHGNRDASDDRGRDDLRHLRKQGLIETVRLPGYREHAVVLTEEGRGLLESHRDHDRDHHQTFHSGLVRARAGARRPDHLGLARGPGQRRVQPGGRVIRCCVPAPEGVGRLRESAIMRSAAPGDRSAWPRTRAPRRCPRPPGRGSPPGSLARAPAASRSSTSFIRMRRPRMHGRPPQTSGFTVIRARALIPAF